MVENEYIIPLKTKADTTNTGIIQAVDFHGRRFNVAEITFERHGEADYQYIIRPYWLCIEFLPDGVFQGIPGIDLDLGQDEYYRVNFVPAFIEMRTPSESRVDVRELMEEVGLDYYDRFEWLLRTNRTCGDDNLKVMRKREPLRININDIGQVVLVPGDIVEVDSLSDITGRMGVIVERMYRLLQSGANIFINKENRLLELNERRAMLYMLKNILEANGRFRRNRIEEGIEIAKVNHKYAGRKPIEVNQNELNETAILFKDKEITEQEAMNRLGLKSRSTFYRKLKSIK